MPVIGGPAETPALPKPIIRVGHIGELEGYGERSEQHPTKAVVLPCELHKTTEQASRQLS